ncbi:MAG TPA: gamma-glutamyltransferase [Steroidobacteraceae bacterium]|nr:gamma-glutamyltransferase [Steroidobacteraceae bacterium]
MPRRPRLATLLLSTLACAAVTLSACSSPRPATAPAIADHAQPQTAVAATQGAFAMPDRYSADVVEQVLRAGGNAVDAAVAGAFALAVTYPEAGNLGGGGFMLIHVDGQNAFLDYREVAPAAATRDMYLDAHGEVIEGLSLTGHRAVGVPGTVAGLWEAHRRHGKLSWSTVVAPAVELAEHGFEVPSLLEQRVADDAERLASTNFRAHFAGLRAASVFRQPQLAATLRRVQAEGADGFYRGETARLIVAEMRRGDGLVSLADLERYRPAWRTPLLASWHGRTVVAAPPPSSGGFALLQLLGMKAALRERFAGVSHNSTEYVHLVAEMEKRVFADRAEYAGDPDFVTVPVERLIDPSYIARRAREVNPHAISTVAQVRPGLVAEPRHTTHYSIVDRWGNAVANTYTLNTDFGSGVVVEGAGFLLNNEMDDFSAKPGVPNYYGVVGADANAIAPGKRMLSSMSPTLVLDRRGEVEAVVGSMGGSTIITQVYQVLANLYDFGMSPADAVAANRFHHQLLPPTQVTYDPALPGPTLDGLKSLGYEPARHPWPMGDVQLVVRDDTGWLAVSDPRARGVARVLRSNP